MIRSRRDGAMEVNETKGTKKRISKRAREAALNRTPEQQAAQDIQALPPTPGSTAPDISPNAPPLPHAPGTEPGQDTGTAERVYEHIDGAHTRKASKKAARKAQAEAEARAHTSRLQFTEEERATPELEKYIKKSDKAADKLDEARAKIPKEKKLVKERTFDEATGKGKTRLHFQEREKPMNGNKAHKNPLSRPAGYHSHKLKPYRAAAKAEKAAEKANANYLYQKALHDNPQIAASNPFSRYMQKQRIKKQYAKSVKAQSAKTVKNAAENTRKAAKKTAEGTKKTVAFIGRHPAGVCIAVGALLLFIMVSSALSSCGAMFSGMINGIVGTSYTSEDADLVAVENNYMALETELQREIDNIERDHPGYDEYRYDLDSIGHNPHELASYLTALLQTYTPATAQAEIQRIFELQYTLTLTEEVEVRHRTETRTGTRTVTDPVTGETSTETYEYEVDVAYNYYILNIKLENKPISDLAPGLLTPEQLEMFRVYLETSGNKPLVFGGGSPDTNPSEDLSGVQLVNGTRPGNTAIVDRAKSQVGNVGGQPYWSWYGFNSRVEWCACFVSWCYNQAGKSEPRFAACQSQGIPWFQSHGQWGDRSYTNIAPGDAIFFDWDLDGSADHVGLVIGTDGQRVYTVEGNSGDACKIKSYPLDYRCIKGYGLMNWN